MGLLGEPGEGDVLARECEGDVGKNDSVGGSGLLFPPRSGLCVIRLWPTRVVQTD